MALFGSTTLAPTGCTPIGLARVSCPDLFRYDNVNNMHLSRPRWEFFCLELLWYGAGDGGGNTRGVYQSLFG